MDEADLYGDLDEYRPRKRKAGSDKDNRDSEVASELQKELQKAKDENEVLKRNMGTLFRTARAELRRKDQRIAELEEQLQTRHQ